MYHTLLNSKKDTEEGSEFEFELDEMIWSPKDDT